MSWVHGLHPADAKKNISKDCDRRDNNNNHFDNDNNNFMVGFSSEQLEIGMSVFVDGSRKTSIIITPCVVYWKTYHLF